MSDSCRARRSIRLLGALLLLAPAAGSLSCQPKGGPNASVAFGDVGAGPAVLEQAVNEGGPNPAPLTVQLSNNGTCDLDYTVNWATVDGLDWLSVDPTGGTLAPGGSDMLSVSLDVIGPPLLDPGTHTGSITIEGVCTVNSRPALGSPIAISVNLRIDPVRAGMTVDDDRLVQDVVFPDDQWSSMASNGPSPREGQVAVWSGTEMILWGGWNGSEDLADGGRYEPITQTWAQTSAVDAPSPREGASAVWTGTEMVVWGGTNRIANLDDGGRYDPEDDTWTPIPPSAGDPDGLYGQSAVWTGTHMIVWGGADASSTVTQTGSSYDPADGSWTPISTVGAPAAREGHVAVWTGSRMLVWGGDDGPNLVDGGGLYDPATDQWTAMATSHAPTSRRHAVAVWTGKEMVVWGGVSDTGVGLSTGARFDPVTNTWADMYPLVRGFVWETAVWTGQLMLVWGARNDFFTDAAGGMYDPASDQWFAMTLTNAPAPRGGHAAVWTGREMLVWAGFTGTGCTPGVPCGTLDYATGGKRYH